MVQSILDPLDGRRAEDLFAAAPERFDFFAERVDSSLRLDQGLGERLAAAAFADEVDEIGEPALFSRELGLFQLQSAGQVGAQLRDLFFDAL